MPWWQPKNERRVLRGLRRVNTQSSLSFLGGLLPSHDVDPGWAGIGTDGEDKANKERGSKAGWDGLGSD